MIRKPWIAGAVAIVCFVAISWISFWLGFQKGALFGLKSEHDSLRMHLTLLRGIEKSGKQSNFTEVTTRVDGLIALTQTGVRGTEDTINLFSANEFFLIAPTDAWGLIKLSNRTVPAVLSDKRKD